MHGQVVLLFANSVGGLGFLLVVAAASVAVGHVLRRVFLRKVARWATKTATQIDDIVVASVKGPVIIWFLILGLYLGLELSSHPERVVNVVQKALVVLAVLSVTLVAANMVSRIVRAYGGRVEAALPVTSLTQHVSRLVIFALGPLIILNTLANLFAGFHIVAAKQVRVGDYVKLESGEEGYVTDISWRTTKIRMLPNNVVLVPNDRIAKAIVTNYYLPEEPMSVLLGGGVHYASDLRKVQQVTCEAGREVMQEVPGGVPDFDPFIRYHTFGDFSINLNVILRVKEFTDQHIVKQEFIMRLHERFSREGIVIPFPIRAVNYIQEKAR